MIAPCNVKARLYICWGVNCVLESVSFEISLAVVSVMNRRAWMR